MKTQKKTTNVNIKDSLRGKPGIAIEPGSVEIDVHAIEEGRKPLASRRKDIEALKSRAIELYGIPPEGLSALPPIEARLPSGPGGADEDFQYLQVEPLLEEAGRLLERCSSEGSDRDRLQIEKWKLQLELDRFFRFDQLEELERTEGFDTLPYERAARDTAAEQSVEEHQRNAETQWKGLMEDLLSSGFNKRMAARELAAWISSYPLRDSEAGGDEATYTFDGAQKSKPDHLYDAARVEVDQGAWEQIYSLMAQRYAAWGAAEAGRLRKESLALQSKWSLSDIGFRREKAKVRRDLMWEKIFQAQSSGSSLNYQEKIAASERRFAVDFHGALSRLVAVSRGLKELYGYAPAFPQEGTPGYFDEVVHWTKGAQDKIAQFSSQDQCYELAVSLKQLAKGQWEAGREAGEWTFEIPEEVFPGQAHVRLRGLGMAVLAARLEETGSSKQKSAAVRGEASQGEGPKCYGFWSARVSLPATGVVRPLSGDARELDQKALPVCHLGRVTDLDFPREHEIAGVQTLHNASPIGKPWKVALTAKSTSGTPTSQLQDLHLFLRVAVRSRRVDG